MKTFTSILLVNRLKTSFIFLICLLFAGNIFAATDISYTSIKCSTISSGIEYASLVASANEKAVYINWVTVSEKNNSHFEVERSLDNKDFKTVALVLDGFVTEGTGKSYKFKEDAGEVRKGKTVYYRLKQIDNDQQFQYSTVLTVQLNTTVTIIWKQDAVQIKSIDQYTNSFNIFNNQNFYNTNGEKLLSKQSVKNNAFNGKERFELNGFKCIGQI